MMCMSESTTPPLGELGVWRRGPDIDVALASQLDVLGYGALWIGSSPAADLEQAESLIAGTASITVATGIVNIWSADPAELAASFRRIESRYPGRLLLGIGVGHPEAQGERARAPYSAMVDYLDVLDDAGVPRSSLVLAALGPRMLRLARDRTAGAHPYLVTSGYTGQARETLGAGPLLAPEQRIVLRSDAEEARAVGRPSLANYLRMSNYLRNFERLGFGEDDFAEGGSDALVDALVVYGTDAEVVAGLRAHLDAGADHVAAQLITASGDDTDQQYGRLARAFGLSPRRA
jgi:probable F420-dependent oxidoreductase